MAIEDLPPPGKVSECPDCGRTVRLIPSPFPHPPTMIDPEPIDEPDPEGRCIVCVGINGRAANAIFEDVRGRFRTYRQHAWSCSARGPK